MTKLSLKTRLILSFFAASTLIMSSAGVLSWLESREQLDEFFDTYQILLARQLATADWHNIGVAAQKSVNKLVDNLDDDGEEDDEAIGMAVFDAQGKIIFHDDENGKHFVFLPQASGFENQEIGHKKKSWRVLWMSTADKQHKIAVGQELKYRDEMAFDLIEEFLLPWIYGMGVLLLLVIWLVHRELQPLRKMATNLAARGSNDFSALEERNLPKEILPLSRAMNELFVKIAEMLKRERSFISDSAHELRSPLTALKVQLEVLELSGDDKKVQANALNNLKTGIDRSTRLVEQMLALSRLESHVGSIENEELLDWHKLLSEVIAEQEAASGRALDIQVVNLKKCPIHKGQGLLWSLLMRNLIDNAVRYSPKGSEIKVEFNEAGVVISNSGVMIDEKHLLHLSERFFRPAGQKMSGSGLGLSIVEKIASLHGYRVRYENIDNLFIVKIEK